jgi:hypothetical protein
MLMRSNSNDTSFSHKNVEGEVMVSNPTKCMCNLPIKEKKYFSLNLFTEMNI